MRRSLVKFSESEASNHRPSLADFTTTAPELKFSVHTGPDAPIAARLNSVLRRDQTAPVSIGATTLSCYSRSLNGLFGMLPLRWKILLTLPLDRKASAVRSSDPNI